MNKPLLVTLLVLFAASPLVTNQLNPNVYVGGRSKDERDREIRNSSALATILGEVRTNMSDMLFIKTERYLHSGIAYMPHIDMDKLAATGEITDSDSYGFAKKFSEHEAEVGVTDEGHDHDHDHDHGEEESGTLIPDPEDDFRGVVGWLHRHVKPWQDPNLPHIHTTGQELLPWYRLMTLTDPHNLRGYVIGTWWLKTNRTDASYQEALKFIDEGIANNTEAFSLYLNRGYLLRQMERHQDARASFLKAGEFAAKHRPHDRIQPYIEAGTPILLPDWTDYDEEEARSSVRMAVLAERDHGDKAKAAELARQYSAIFKGDARLDAMAHDIGQELMGAGPVAP